MPPGNSLRVNQAMTDDKCHQCGSSMLVNDTGNFCSACLLRAVIEFQPEPPEDELPEINGYEIIEEIGRGGVGRVYRARQKEPNREVALKLVLDSQLAGEEARKQFLQEIELAATLEHPAITPIYDAGRQSGFLYFSSQLMPKGDLSVHLDFWVPNPSHDRSELRERQSRVARLVEQMALALHHAHQHGVIHQDIKTSNILLDQNGNPFLSDFGLASRSSLQPSGPTNITGKISGSPSYMAPEQLENGHRSASVDLYSLGVVLYELLTGTPPFESDSLPAMTQMIRHQDVSFGPGQTHLSPTLKAICLKCLAKDPGQRYSSARALAEDLRASLEHRPVIARPLGSLGKLSLWGRRRPAQAVIAALLLSAITWMALHAIGQAQDNEAARLEAEHEEAESRHRLIQQLFQQANTAGQKKEYQMAVSNLMEAASLSHDSSEKRNQALNLLAAWSPALPRTVQHPSGLRAALAISPDGTQMATWSFGSRCCFWSIEKGTRPILNRSWKNPTGPLTDVSFSPDLKRIIVSSDQEARILNFETLETIKTLPFNKSRVCAQPFNLPRGISRFNQDGSLIAVALQGDSVTVWDSRKFSKLHQFPIPKTIIGDMGDTLDVLFRSDEAIVGWRGGFLVGNLLEGPSRFFPAGLRMDSIVLSPSGKLLATGDIDNSIKLYRTGSYKMTGKGTHQSRVSQVAFSHDEKYLLTSSRDRSARIWTIKKDGSLHLKKTIHHPAAVTACHWFPDQPIFATSAEDGVIRYFSAPTGRLITTQQVKDSRLKSWRFHHDSKTLCIGTEDGHILSYNIPTPEPFFTQSRHQVRAVRCEPGSSKWVGISDLDNGTQSLSSWEGNTLTQEIEVGHEDSKYSMSLSRDGRFAACGGETGITIWDSQSGKKIWENQTIGERVTRTAITEKQKELIVAAITESKELILMRPDSPSDPYRYSVSDSVQCLTFSPDGSHLAVGYPSGQILLLQTDQPASPPRQLSQSHSNQVLILEFNSTGNLLASGGMDGQVWIHDINSGHPISPAMKHNDYVWALAFSDDSQVLASGGQEYSVHFFHIPTGRQIGPPLVQSAWINGLAFRGDHFLACGSDRSIRRLPMPPKNNRQLSEWREQFDQAMLTEKPRSSSSILRLKQ